MRTQPSLVDKLKSQGYDVRGFSTVGHHSSATKRKYFNIVQITAQHKAGLITAINTNLAPFKLASSTFAVN
jgi:nucleoside-triphosphatase THEP1